MYKHTVYKLILILILFLPWINADYTDQITPVELVQEDTSFFEINICEISIFEFIIKNPKSIYQDHYFFDFNSKTPIRCFGRISGVSVNNDGFFISIGSSPLINLFLQSNIWLLILSFIPKSKKKIETESLINYFSIFLTIYLFTFSIYAEQRFYSNKIYSFEFEDQRSYILLFVLFFWITVNLVSIANERLENLIYYFPLMYLFTGIFVGTNISIISIFLSYFGFYSLFSSQHLKKINRIYILLSVFWLFNSSGRYYFQPGKLRGFTNSSYEFNSNLFWIVLFLLIYNGIFYLYKINQNSFNNLRFIKNWSIASIPILTLGIVGANFPILNIFSKYIFGLQRNIISQQNPFLINEWSERVSWRGMYPSAESIGEFFGIALIFSFILLKKKKLDNKFDKKLIYFALIISTLGLISSDNRTVAVLCLAFLIYLYSENFKFKKFYFFSGGLLLLIILVYIAGFQNFQFPYNFTSTFIFNRALDFKVHYETSSFLEYLNSSYSEKTIFSIIFGVFSTISFLLNRSELWAIFSARYNPTFLEALFGSGPLTFGQVYGELNIKETESFFLPHSSLISYIVFFGVVAVFIMVTLLIFNLLSNKRRIGSIGIFIILYILINILKNDSLNYLSIFTNYLLVLFLILKGNFLRLSSK